MGCSPRARSRAADRIRLDTAVNAASAALPWMTLAGLGQFTAGLLASALAALDDYVVSASGYIVGSIAGLTLIILRIDENRTDAVAWGMALNAILATIVPATWLWYRSRREQMPATAAKADPRSLGSRLLVLGVRRCSPVRTSGDLSRLLAVRGGRRGRLGDHLRLRVSHRHCRRRRGRVVARACHRGSALTTRSRSRSGRTTCRGVVLAGPPRGRCDRRHVRRRRGRYRRSRARQCVRGHVGAQIGRVVVALAPYMVASVALAVTFPLVFVAGRTSRLPRRPGNDRPPRSFRLPGTVGRGAGRDRNGAGGLHRTRVRLDPVAPRRRARNAWETRPRGRPGRCMCAGRVRAGWAASGPGRGGGIRARRIRGRARAAPSGGAHLGVALPRELTSGPIHSAR